MKPSVNHLRELAEYLHSTNRSTNRNKSIVGFDRLVAVVEKRVSAVGHDKNGELEPIDQFSERLNFFSKNISSSMLRDSHYEGHAHVFSKAVEKLGGECTCMWAMQVPANSVLKHLETDWKRIASELLAVSHEGNPDLQIKNVCNEDQLHQANRLCTKNDFVFMGVPDCISEVDLIAFTEWDKSPDACELADAFLHKVVKPSGKRNFRFLFDFADVANKSVFEVDEILDVVSCFSSYGKVMFCVHEDVATKVWLVLRGYEVNKPFDVKEIPDISEIGLSIFNAMNIECLIVYSLTRTHMVINRHVFEMNGRWIEHQVPSRFVGDNHSAGILIGTLMGLPNEHCMLLGLATMGAYMQNESSPDIPDVLMYLSQWIDEIITNDK